MGKVQAKATKIYKPEVLTCPFCNADLKYKFAVSNKVVQFTSGKITRIKNLGYGCPNCNDGRVYFSQTANKLSFKGYTYSAKVICMIYYYKALHCSRDTICDILQGNGIAISERNIDIIYNSIKEEFEVDHTTSIFEAYEQMLKTYGEIRLSIDLIRVENTRYLIVYDFFTSKRLNVFSFNDWDSPELRDYLALIIKKDMNITYIVSIRNLNPFKLIPYLKFLAPDSTKFIAYSKF